MFTTRPKLFCFSEREKLELDERVKSICMDKGNVEAGEIGVVAFGIRAKIIAAGRRIGGAD